MNVKLSGLLLVVALAVGAVPASAQTPGNGSCVYRATYVADVTIPDDTVLDTGERFVKTWRIRNDSTCPWGSNGYAVHGLAYWGGDRLDGPDLVALPGMISPGQTVDISVNMAAPALAGVYLSEWMLKVDTNIAPERGEYLGVGPSGQQPLYTRIIVRSPVPSYENTRIRFEPGATMAAVEGQLNGQPARDYLIRALKGQTMVVTLSGPESNLRLQVLLRGTRDPLRGQASNEWYWRGALPANGDYVIRVTSNNATARYAFTVQVPYRISFARGAVSGLVQGKTNDRRTVTYLVRARQGQNMTVELAVPRDAAALTIYGLEDGQPLVRAPMGQTTWTGRLPATQDYVIDVVPGVDGTIDFSLRVTVR
ncbi:MAG: NBR1-Ig-like domain-containing protein [Chloroflexi bacterium]|nr:NBR1-Ig-like domain-containing protein [Chloroflexota bacterium]